MTTVTTTMGSNQTCRGGVRPSWLQATLTDLEQRFHALSLHLPDTSPASDSFADRAENYYQKRPQLISLVHDLYNRYISLADRYVQSLLKPAPPRHCRSQSQASLVHSDLDDTDTITNPDTDPPDLSDNESSLSYQTPPPPPSDRSLHLPDTIVANVITNLIHSDLLAHEAGILEKFASESARKMDLQSCLLEVLESERLVLLTENARLGFKAKAVVEENEGLLAEVAFMRRKAGELARCVVKLREDHRVCMLGRKIEALQAQIYGLEKRNKECYEVMARREEEKTEIVSGVCGELERVKAENRRLKEVVKKRDGKLWGKVVVRKVEGWVLCGSHDGVK